MDIFGFRTFFALAFDKLDSLPFSHRMRIAFQIVCMNKNVFAAIFRGNESKPFLHIEKLYCTFRLQESPLYFSQIMLRRAFLCHFYVKISHKNIIFKELRQEKSPFRRIGYL